MATTAQSYSDEKYLAQRCSLSDLPIQTDPPPLIFRLHPDILQIIFIYCARDHCRTNHYPAVTIPSWVNVSYVCHHWRNVALACPALWSYIFLVSPQWTKELLARSKQALLTVQVHSRFSAEEFKVFRVGQVGRHAERFQNLYLQLDNKDMEKMFYSELSSRAPRLQNLTIVIDSGPRTKRFPILFEGETPALRTLKLSRCSVPWCSFKLSGLTTLGLYDVPAPYRKNLAEFLVILRSMQDLENLYLHDTLLRTAGFVSSAESRAFQKVYLPHLSRLLIVAPLSTVVAFLTFVNIPLETQLRLDCEYEDGISVRDHVSPFLVLWERYDTSDQAPSNPILRSLVIDFSEPLTTLTFSPLELDFDSFSHRYMKWNNPLRIRIGVGSSVTSSNLGRILTEISSLVPLADVQGVHVLSPPFPSEFWRMLLGHLQGLRCMLLCHGGLPDLAPVLSLNDDEGTHAKRVFAPALEELELYGVMLPRPGKRIDGEMADLQSLCNALATRTEAPGRLIVSGCVKPVRPGILQLIAERAGEWKGGHLHLRKVGRRRG